MRVPCVDRQAGDGVLDLKALHAIAEYLFHQWLEVRAEVFLAYFPDLVAIKEFPNHFSEFEVRRSV